MTMHISLSPEMENYIRSKVAGGFYGNATEVIRDAIRRMQAEETRLEAWRAAVQKGEDDIARGETVVYTGDELRAIAAEAASDEYRKPADPDVLP